jgi:3-keto-disaccharide hydrolase
VTRAVAAAIMALALGAAGMASSRDVSGEWRPLFDGKTTAGWRGFMSKDIPDGWKAVDGALTRVGKAGDIVTVDQFDDFELTLDWKIAKGANSGIFYRVVENPQDDSMWMLAPEYQIIDDKGYPEKLKDTQHTGANYDLQPPGRDVSKPAGEWNSTRIVANGKHVEHWLNGVKLVEYEIDSPEWKGLVAKSKFKDHPRYARAPKGSIGIQDHGDWAAFRNIKIRELH